jgi:anti-anti-sigma regulatory factor
MMRLYGTLGARELARVTAALHERGRSPRDLVTIDFEQVVHLDYRALPEFAAELARHRDRGAVIWLMGLNDYVRRLFDVAGQGPILRRMEWSPEGEEIAARPIPFGLNPRVTSQGRAHRGSWE